MAQDAPSETVKIIHSMNWDRTASQGVRNVT